MVLFKIWPENFKKIIITLQAMPSIEIHWQAKMSESNLFIFEIDNAAYKDDFP
jgi:hypothetical protein